MKNEKLKSRRKEIGIRKNRDVFSGLSHIPPVFNILLTNNIKDNIIVPILNPGVFTWRKRTEMGGKIYENRISHRILHDFDEIIRSDETRWEELTTAIGCRWYSLYIQCGAFSPILQKLRIRFRPVLVTEKRGFNSDLFFSFLKHIYNGIWEDIEEDITDPEPPWIACPGCLNREAESIYIVAGEQNRKLVCGRCLLTYCVR